MNGILLSENSSSRTLSGKNPHFNIRKKNNVNDFETFSPYKNENKIRFTEEGLSSQRYLV
jgi:hypothetical protein